MSVILMQIWLHITYHTSRKQPEIYRVVYVSLYTHILNITYTPLQNNTQI